MLCCVDGRRRLWRMLCRYYHPHRFYGFTALLAAIVLSAHVLGSVVWVVWWKVSPSHFLLFVCVVGISLVIHGLLMSPMYSPTST
jgi:hypothetical protein